MLLASIASLMAAATAVPTSEHRSDTFKQTNGHNSNDSQQQQFTDATEVTAIAKQAVAAISATNITEQRQ